MKKVRDKVYSSIKVLITLSQLNSRNITSTSDALSIYATFRASQIMVDMQNGGKSRVHDITIFLITQNPSIQIISVIRSASSYDFESFGI